MVSRRHIKYDGKIVKQMSQFTSNLCGKLYLPTGRVREEYEAKGDSSDGMEQDSHEEDKTGDNRGETSDEEQSQKKQSVKRQHSTGSTINTKRNKKGQ